MAIKLLKNQKKLLRCNFFVKNFFFLKRKMKNIKKEIKETKNIKNQIYQFPLITGHKSCEDVNYNKLFFFHQYLEN